ncbi:Isochorismatase hydrolase [Vararia minispora EC-137]|uniref:Isochorismatase hydrolase n=1 Tax=Vararia minispora EC-137 TaxID=1314806 RepID=A0ACB8QM98_9AGAM|nr:Isochorismatase hydrolase [Vararia minispora EC-137]
MSLAVPIHDQPILGMTTRPRVGVAKEYGNASEFWVEYPSGLVDVSRKVHLPAEGEANEPPRVAGLLDIAVDGDRVVRLNPTATAYVIVDMQNFFLHPDMRVHPTGLACVDPILKSASALREKGVKILWVNWGLTDHELETIPPSLVRGFQKSGRGGFGAEIPGGWGRLLMRGARNSELYGPLQDAYVQGEKAGTDVWIHKNRMSGLWGYQTALDLYLRESGIKTLFVAGVNADQCVLGTMVDAYYRGYDLIVVKDGIATTSPEGGLENVIYNAGSGYGFTTDSTRVAQASE